MCHGFPLTSQHCVAEAALVTTWGLFIGVEGIPEHFATSLFPRFLGRVPLGDALMGGALGTSAGIWVSALYSYDSAVFICPGGHRGQSPSLSDL